MLCRTRRLGTLDGVGLTINYLLTYLRPGAVAGIGGGGILTSVMIVISDVVSLQKRGTYQGILGMVVAISNSIGPLVGGVFSEKVTWRWCFVGLPSRNCLPQMTFRGREPRNRGSGC